MAKERGGATHAPKSLGVHLEFQIKSSVSGNARLSAAGKEGALNCSVCTRRTTIPAVRPTFVSHRERLRLRV
jgi:hypothetical protein